MSGGAREPNSRSSCIGDQSMPSRQWTTTRSSAAARLAFRVPGQITLGRQSSVTHGFGVVTPAAAAVRPEGGAVRAGDPPDRAAIRSEMRCSTASSSAEEAARDPVRGSFLASDAPVALGAGWLGSSGCDFADDTGSLEGAADVFGAVAGAVACATAAPWLWARRPAVPDPIAITSSRIRMISGGSRSRAKRDPP